VPRTIDYQGVLTDDTGRAVADGMYSMTFRLYAAPSGVSALCEETQSVTVSKGMFSVILGTVTPLNMYFNDQFYLDISVEGEAELSPRVA
jgi:hypothetical protein